MNLRALLRNVTLIMVMSVVFIACNNQDGVEPAPNEPQEPSLAITTEDLSQKISVKNGEKLDGVPPVPNDETHYTIESGTNIKAYPTYGFNIELSSDKDIKGVYIQFVDAEGNPADNYFKVPIGELAGGVASPDGKKTLSLDNALLSKLSANLNKAGEKSGDGATIDVDFENTLEPGEFCFYICPYYDEDGNLISYSSQICVEVEAWGGDALIHGEWHFTHEDASDETATITCSDGTVLTVPIEVEIQKEEVSIYDDGTISWSANLIVKKLNTEASETACEAVYDTEFHYRRTWTGNWSYDIGVEELTFIAFHELSEVLINETDYDYSGFNYEYDIPDGEVFLPEWSTSIVGTGIAGDEMIMDWGGYPGGTITFIRQ